MASTEVPLYHFRNWCYFPESPPARWRDILAPFPLFQDNVLNIINQIMDMCIPQDRAPRDFCVKFPEEIRHDNLAGQLWFGAEVAAVAWVQGHGVGIVQPFVCEPWSTWSMVLNVASGELLWAGQGGDRSHMTGAQSALGSKSQ